MAEQIPTAAELERMWRQGVQSRRRQGRRDLLNDLLRVATREIDEEAFALFDLGPERFIKRRSFRRYYRSTRIFAWKQALLAVHPRHLEAVLGGFDTGYLKIQPGSEKQLETIRRDLTFFDVVTDSFEQDGFLSVALHVTLRILGEIEKRPDNLVQAVRLSEHLDQVCVQDQERFRTLEVVDG